MSVPAATLGYRAGLTTAQVQKLTPEERMEYMKFITELRKTIEQLKMETVESYSQVVGIEAQVLGEVTAAYLDARATGDLARANAIAALGPSMVQQLKMVSDPDPEFRQKIAPEQSALTTQVMNTAKTEGQKLQDITPQQLVDTYLNAVTNAQPGQLGTLELANMRNKYNLAVTDPTIGPAARGYIGMTGRSMAENGILQGLKEAGKTLGLDEAMVADAYLDKQDDFRKFIGINPDPLDAATAVDEKNKLWQEIAKTNEKLSSQGTSIGALDPYLQAVRPETLGQLVEGGPSELLISLRDEVVAPESAQFIADLQKELRDSIEARDAFQRGIDAYSRIPGADQLRSALGLDDDYRFAYYVTRNPGAFNEALRGVNKAAAAVQRNPNLLSTAEMRGVVAKGLAADRREKPEAQTRLARRLANQPGRMRRMLRQEARKEDRDLAKEIAETGLAGVPDVAAKGADVDVNLRDVGTGIGGTQPSPTKTLSVEEQIAALEKQLETATGADADEIRNEIAQLKAQLDQAKTAEQPAKAKAPLTPAPTPDQEAKTAATIAGAGVQDERIAAQERLKLETSRIAGGLSGDVPEIDAVSQPEIEETGPTPGDTAAGTSIVGGKTPALSSEELTDIRTSIVSRFGSISADPSTVIAQASAVGRPGLTKEDAKAVLNTGRRDMSGVKYEGIPKPPLKPTEIDLSSASKGMLEGPNVRERTSLTANEMSDLRTVQNNQGEVVGGPNIKAAFRREGKDITFSQASRMAKFLEEQEAQRRREKRLQTSEPDEDKYGEAYDYE